MGFDSGCRVKSPPHPQQREHIEFNLLRSSQPKFLIPKLRKSSWERILWTPNCFKSIRLTLPVPSSEMLLSLAWHPGGCIHLALFKEPLLTVTAHPDPRLISSFSRVTISHSEISLVLSFIPTSTKVMFRFWNYQLKKASFIIVLPSCFFNEQMKQFTIESV